MSREERQYELSLEAISSRLNDIKIAISDLILKLETEYEVLNWPTVLDNFALISTHLTGVSKILANQMCPLMRNRIVLPINLSEVRDESLVSLTEGRLPIFAHDVVPNYLRTKPEPSTEQKIMQNESKAANVSTEAAMKQVTQFNKILTHLDDMLSKALEDFDNSATTRPTVQQTSSLTDTHTLVAAVGMGKGIRPIHVPGTVPGGMMIPPIRANAPNTVGGAIGKAPSTIKTNIKSAMQVHPFPR